MMTLNSLLVCADTETVQVLKSVLQELGIKVEHCADPGAASSQLDSITFDLLLVDCQEEAGAQRLIAHARGSAANAGAVIIAMVNLRNQVRDLFDRGVTFVLYKPISRERATSSLRSAQELIHQERRVHPRIPLQAVASIDYPGKEQVSAEIVDISETGIAFRSSNPLPRCSKVYLQFSVPGDSKVIRMSGEMMWQDSAGRVGLRFSSVPQSSRRILEDWLKTAVSVKKPAKAPLAQASAPQAETTRARITTGLGLLSASSDRRSRSRHPCCLGAEVYTLDSNVPQRCNLTDVSTGGCYIETTEPHPAGTQLRIALWAQGLKLELSGAVQSTNPGFGMGVKFALQTTDQRKQVEQLMACARAEAKLLR